MLYYANVRKATVKESYALDAVAGEELGKEKLDYTGYTLKNLPWKNFRRFFQYNVMDVVLLHLLEKKNLDMDLVQRLSEIINDLLDISKIEAGKLDFNFEMLDINIVIENVDKYINFQAA